MSQILHIFRKDVRHLWMEIVASLVLLVAYTWRTIHVWGTPDTGPDILRVLWRLVTPLLPISWCLLMIRAVQDESLVGDRQFWITRPYEWPKLLAAKGLLALTFISLPLFVADTVLLDQAGFPVLHCLPGLFWMQVLLATFLILPTVVAATVTSTVVQVLISIVGIVLYLIAAASLTSAIHNAGVGPGADLVGTCALVIFLGVAFSTTLVQYARRWAWASRSLTFAGAALVLLITAVMPYSTLIARAYPPAGAPPTIELQPPSGHAAQNGVPFVPLVFPVHVSGVAAGTVVMEEGSLTTMGAPDGRTWTSHWLPSLSLFWPGEEGAAVEVLVDKKFVEQEGSVPVRVDVSFALTSYREMDSRQIVAQEGQFPVPGVGNCWLETARQTNGNVFHCRAPLVSRPFMARVEPSSSTCPPLPSSAPNDLGTRYGWGGRPGRAPAEFGISPIVDFNLWFERWTDKDRATAVLPPGACPGTSFTVSTPEKGNSVRVHAELTGVRLSDYVLESH